MNYKVKIIILAVLLSGCAVAYISETATLMEKPFAVVTMNGDVTQATRCIGRYWQTWAVNTGGKTWNVITDSYQVRVIGPSGAGTPPVGLVVDVDVINGKTVAKAHIHSIFLENDYRRTITLEALDSCKAK